jgi:hypothetical protein
VSDLRRLTLVTLVAAAFPAAADSAPRLESSPRPAVAAA